MEVNYEILENAFGISGVFVLDRGPLALNAPWTGFAAPLESGKENRIFTSKHMRTFVIIVQFSATYSHDPHYYGEP